MKNNTEIVSKTKQNLIDAFWHLYCEKRIEKITIKEITVKAGYNRSTFYEYFTDIYDVLEQIENSLIPSLDELPPISILNKNNEIPLNMFLKLYEQNEKYYSVLLGDNGDPAFASKLKNSIKPLLKEALVKDTKLNDLEFDFVLEYILSSMISIMSYWFKNDKILPSDKLIFIMKNIMENGIQGIFNK
ncbi:TetR/AcrR family transcriptional regulator [Romboutsia lituseburensis]|uniref:DNA-binding transcriptional regulator, AcrR family n=1 Tax=Romboutsia lituseburensis DSM 797 TaxID=1121325 RepID=A0A1G9MLK6_9FIRM|nr:TetR/AcrR family transcriptional regulator [Romboutsia lituseburensis]CEH34408.1 Homeodomain-like [Romboutsia lituseburensis]SDL75014.1 DNA-binding transcriptional regulator, AcrR family [Romboutsia lituseburensis DSM 797]